jgi:hypothetical protein
MRLLTTTTLTALLALGLAGCETELTGATSGRSRMQVGVRGDDPAGSANTSRSSGARYALSGGGSGSVEVKARVWVETEAGQWVELTHGAATETVEASGSDGEQVIANAEVAAESYHRVRVEFERVQASLIGNVSIGGSLLGGSLTVDTGSDGKIVVEREIDLEARAGATQSLTINLNAAEWMERADTETRAVAEAEFRNAVTVAAE